MRSLQRLVEVEHLRPQRLLAREGQQLAHQRGAAVGVLLDLDDVLEAGIGRLVRVEQEIGRHHDDGEHVVEVVRDAAGELADRLHLLLLVDAVLQVALRGGLQRVDDGRLAVAVLVLDRRHEKRGPAFAGAGERGFDRRNVALPLTRLADRRFERRPVALGDDRKDRALVAFQHALEGGSEARIVARDARGLVDGGDRHGGVLEEAHEAHFRRPLRIAAVVLGAVEHQRARGARRTVGAERHLVEQAHRHRLAAARLEVEVEHLGLHLAGRGVERGQERRALTGDDVIELERAGPDLRQIVIEPVGERGVEIDNVARRIDREKAGRRVVEIIDGVLQFLEHVFLALAVARHVGDRPHRHAGVVLAQAERTHVQAQPARAMRRRAGHAHLLLQATALARRLEQPVDRLGDVGIADEDPLDRAHVVGVGRPDQVEIGGVGVEHAARLVGDHDAVGRPVDYRLEQRVTLAAARQMQDTGGKPEQRGHADGAEQRQQRQDIGAAVARFDVN